MEDGAAKSTKNPDIDKYQYSGYGIGFDRSFHLAMDLVNM